MVGEPMRKNHSRAGVLFAALFIWGSFVPSSHAEEASSREQVLEMYAKYKQNDFSEIPDFAAAEAMSLADSLAFVILDVREPKEREVSILAGSVDRKTYDEHRQEWKGRPVLVYCTIGYRSGLATKKLREEGVEAYNIIGGMLGWAHAGGEVLDGKTLEPTRRIHIYGSRWNLLPPGWQGVW
jgi:rhodanese-related sulfurtransferase